MAIRHKYGWDVRIDMRMGMEIEGEGRRAHHVKAEQQTCGKREKKFFTMKATTLLGHWSTTRMVGAMNVFVVDRAELRTEIPV